MDIREGQNERGEFSKVDDPKILLPVLESRHPLSCFIVNQVNSSKSFGDCLQFYILGDTISDNTWIITKHVRENCGDNISISAPSPLSDKEINKMKECLSSTPLIPWDDDMVFVALDKQVSGMICDISVNWKGNVTEMHPCILYFMEKEATKNLTITLPPGIEVRRLKPEESDFISSTWMYSDESDIPKCIKSIASTGVFIDGNCVSGAITCEYGQISALYTVKEHRKNGYAKLAMNYLFKELAKDDCFPCLSVEMKNERSIAFHQSLGAKAAAVVDWIGVTKLDID